MMLPTAFSPSFSAMNARAVAALVIVSMVVKVFEAMMKSVVSGVEQLQRIGDMGAVDIGDEMQRAGRHGRAPAPASP